MLGLVAISWSKGAPAPAATAFFLAGMAGVLVMSRRGTCAPPTVGIESSAQCRRRRNSATLLRSEVLHVNVSSQPRVVGEIPAVMVGIFVDHDLVAIPEPVGGQCQVKRGNAESPSVKPETARTAPADVPHVAASEAAGETAVLKGMIKVETGIIASSVMPYPGAVVVDVWGFWVAGVIMKTGSRVGNRS